MTEAGTPLIVKHYAGTRLCDAVAGVNLSLDDLAQRVSGDDDIVVTEAETREDLTRSVLKQIIVERKSHG